MFLRFFCTFWNFSILHGRKGRIGFSSPKEDKKFPSREAASEASASREGNFYPLKGWKNLSCPPAHVGQSFLIVYSIGKISKKFHLYYKPVGITYADRFVFSKTVGITYPDRFVFNKKKQKTKRSG